MRNDLQLNADKSEVAILGTAPQLRSAAAISTIDVAGSVLQVAPKLKSLGVTIDLHLQFDSHSSSSSSSSSVIVGVGKASIPTS